MDFDGDDDLQDDGDDVDNDLKGDGDDDNEMMIWNYFEMLTALSNTKMEVKKIYPCKYEWSRVLLYKWVTSDPQKNSSL